MVNGNCAVVGCTNSRYKIKVWEKKNCQEHLGQTHKDCPCPRPFKLHIFPSIKLNMEKRKEWIRLVARERKGHKVWTPGQSDMICSKHFADGQPTLANPNPSLDLGYDKPAKKPRRALVRENVVVPTKPSTSATCADQTMSDAEQNTCDGDDGSSKEQCHSCISNCVVVDNLLEKVGNLNKEKDDLKSTVDRLSKQLEACSLEKNQLKSLGMSASSIKTDAKMRFFTGIQTVLIFHALFSVIKPFVPNLVFWRGSKTILSNKAETHRHKRTKTQKLTSKEVFAYFDAFKTRLFT